MKKLLLIFLLASSAAHSQVIADTIVAVQNNGDTVKYVTYRPSGSTTSATPTRLRDSMAIARGLIDLKQPIGSYLVAADITGKVNVSDTNTMLQAYRNAINGKQPTLGFTPVANTVTVNGHALSSNVSVTASDVSLGNVTNESKGTMFTNSTFTGTFTVPNSVITNANLAGSIAYSKLSLTGAILNADLAGSIVYSKLSLTGAILNADLAGSIAYGKLSLTGAILNADLAGSIAYSKLNLTGAILNADLAGSIAYSKLSLTGAILNADLAGSITAAKLVGSDIATVGTIGTGVWQGTVINSTYGGMGVNNGGRTLTIGTNSGTINFPTAATTQTMPIATSTVIGKVASVDIAAGTAAVSATTLFTPTVSGWFRVSVYMKITITGTSPVAGPVTITYTEPDGSVAQSEVMLLHSVTGSVVTTTVNNSTTTGTVSGTLVIYAKTGVAIQYAIAVSGTFGSGRYTAHLACEVL